MGRTVYLRIHEWLIYMGNVGKYTSPMDPSWVTQRFEKIQIQQHPGKI